MARRGVGEGDIVSVICANLPEMFELHFAVPMCGAVLNTINTRLDAATIAHILDHAAARVLFVDSEFADLVRSALDLCRVNPLLVDIEDPQFQAGPPLADLGFERLLEEGEADYRWQGPRDEWQAISLNYTSGTTGNPKGVVYHHRGAYLNAVSNILVWNMGRHPVYLWTLPMFHCNGWCFPWTIAAAVGTSVSLRHVRAEPIFEQIREHKVTHFCGAPVVLNMLINAAAELKRGIDHKVNVMTAASAPPASILEGMEQMGFEVTHAYGLTETYGPAVVCAWHDEWDELPLQRRAALKSRQGVRYPMLEGLMVGDPQTLAPVPKDGSTIGEIFMRGNIVMKGYLNNPRATDEAFRGGWFHSGDLAVQHADGYIEIKDRSKDIIISGGENISSIEIESTLYRHPDVLEAAVVAMPDQQWGESPCAFVTLRESATVDEAGLIAYCREHMAHYKAPRRIVFGALPKTSTGKVQKYVLRQQAAGSAQG